MHRSPGDCCHRPGSSSPQKEPVRHCASTRRLLRFRTLDSYAAGVVRLQAWMAPPLVPHT